MAQILVRDLDEAVVERLKLRAKEEGRSLQSEVRSILEQAAYEQKVDAQTARNLCAKFRRKFRGRAFPDTGELIREDRAR